MGGIEFSMRPENDALNAYITGLAPVEHPEVCLLPTASGDPLPQIAAFNSAMRRVGAEPTSISLFRLGETGADPETLIESADVIYVGGGSMVNLLALWRAHGLETLLLRAHGSGKPVAGYSAGAMCWFEHGISRGTGRPAAERGFGLIAGSLCVHYSQDPGRRSRYRELIAAGDIPGGIALDDHVAATFRGGELTEVVTALSGRDAYRVSKGTGNSVDERPIGKQLLPAERAGPTTSSAIAEMRELRAARRGRAELRPFR